MHPRRNPDVKSTLLPDGYLVVSSCKTDWAHTLNPVGALVWEFCDGSHDVSQIVAEVVDLLPSGQLENLEEQVSKFVSELTASGLLLLETD